MKKIEITVIELTDIKNFFSLIFDKIKFCFSKPKYKIGSKINMGNWGKNLRIISINKDWVYCNYQYITNKSRYSFSEGLVDFYIKK